MIRPISVAKTVIPLVALLFWMNPARADNRVILFSQTYCAPCVVAKKYLEQQGVAYSEFMIDKSSAARDYFIRLGGRGTPFFIVNNQRMQGFQKDRFWELYGAAPPATDPGMKPE